jgi:large subunit ribosomal protein L11
MPSVAEIIKKEIGVEKLSNKDKKDEWVGDISMEKIKEIAKNKDILGNTEEAKIRQIIGSCISYRITIDGKDPREFKDFGKEN